MQPPSTPPEQRGSISGGRLAVLIVLYVLGCVIAGLVFLVTPLGFMASDGCGSACEPAVSVIVLTVWVIPPILVVIGGIGALLLKPFGLKLTAVLIVSLGSVLSALAGLALLQSVTTRYY